MTHWFRTLAASHSRALLVAVWLLATLPGFFTLPPGDRDEARFAQATKQMLQTGDFVDIRNGIEPRNRKPIGIYWLQAPFAAAAAGLARTNPIWPYRLPSALGALAALLAVERLGRRLVGAEAALLAAALLGTSLVLTVESHAATTDAALLGATSIAMLLLGEAYCTGRLSAARAAAFWVAVGAGVLIKGPITPMVAGLAAATLAVADRRAGWMRALRPGWGVPLALALVLPWFVAIGVATHGGFFRDAIGHDLGGKLTGGAEGHGAPPGTHLLLLSLTLFPAGWAVLMALPAAVAGRCRKPTRFLLAWAVPSWVVFELVPTKLPHYPLPLAPALFLLAAAWLTDPARRPAPRWLGIAAVTLFVLAGGLLGLGAAAAPVLLHAGLLHAGAWLGLPALAAAALLLAASLAALRRGAPARAAVTGAVLALPLYWAVLGLELPRLTALWIAPRVAAALPPGAAFAAAGFAEPSLMFLCGTATAWLGDGGAAAAFLAGPGPRAVLVAGPDMPAFRAAAPPDLPQRAQIDGFDYSTGRFVALHLFARP